MSVTEYIAILINEIKSIRKIDGFVPWIVYQGMELQLCGIRHCNDVIIFEGYSKDKNWTKLLASYSSGMALMIQRKIPAVEKDFDLSKDMEKYFL